MLIRDALAFDDVLLEPKASSLLPHQANTQTWLTNEISLNIPLMSAAMDTVTEAKMAIAMAISGGIGCIHKNMSIEKQVKLVRLVKKYEAGIVYNPITLSPDMLISQALQILKQANITGAPVVDNHHYLLGILTNRDLRFVKDYNATVADLMTKDNLITIKNSSDKLEIEKLLHQNRIEKLILVDEKNICLGLITASDIQKAKHAPLATKDKLGRLRVAASIGTLTNGYNRAKALIEEEIDAIIVDTAHGHASSVLETIKKLRKDFPKLQIIGGNIATASAAEALIEAGVDAVKIGVGPGSICTTRVVSGIGIPQFTAIIDVAPICKKHNIKVIADGGIKYSGDIAKALAAGADLAMVGKLLAGTDESPGEKIIYNERSYKSYRGMGSLAAMANGSADRYFQESKSCKLVPEGVEGMVPYKGKVEDVITQLVGGLKAAMGYTGANNLTDLHKNASFVRITNAGLSESHSHGVIITNESPNYTHSRNSDRLY